MAENKMNEVAALFDVNLLEEFRIKGKSCNYRFAEEGLEYSDCLGCWYPSHIIGALLKGDLEIQRIPWKPENNDKYWYVDYDEIICLARWKQGFLDYARFATGNCFKSRAIAEKCIGKLKGRLIQAYVDNEQLYREG